MTEDYAAEILAEAVKVIGRREAVSNWDDVTEIHPCEFCTKRGLRNGEPVREFNEVHGKVFAHADCYNLVREAEARERRIHQGGALLDYRIDCLAGSG